MYPPSSAPPALSPATVQTTPAGPATGALLIWLGVQILALVVPALRLPLAAKYPSPEELNAVAVMLAVQVGASSLLFPVITREWRTAAASVATLWPILMLAALLAASPPAHVIVPALYVTAWLTCLAVWRAMLPAPALMWAVALAAAVSLGGGALRYLYLEFAPGTVNASSFGPLAAVTALRKGEMKLTAWAWPAGLVAAAAVVIASSRIVRPHAPPTHSR